MSIFERGRANVLGLDACGTCEASAVKRIMLYLAVTLALLGQAQAQDDRAYCNQLVDLYRKYVQNSPGRQFDVEATVAVDDCRKGTNTARAIPILEKKLRASNITPPGGGEFKP
jgi:hypothetical protein